MFEKLKQLKDLREKANVLQQALSTVSAEGSAAWGKVKITMDGTQQITSVTIDPAMLAVDQKSSLEVAVKDAVNDVTKKIQVAAMQKMKETGGLDLPGLTS